MRTHTEGSTPLSDAVLQRLRAILGSRGVITDRDRLVPYESDALATERGLPRAALFPRTEDELAAVVSVLHGANLAFVPRGSGTGLSGGAVARDAVLLCTNRMNRIHRVDPGARRTVVEPGVVTDEITRAAAPHGLRYLPDPASASVSTIGGNVANNAGGPHCLRHGVTTDHVTGLRMVLPDGRRIRLDRGEAGGLDLTGLVVGSEGTLGVVSRIEVRLVPRPEDVRTALGLFEEIRDAGRAVTEILGSGIVPVAMELVDGATLRVVEASRFSAGLPTDAGAALLVESEGFPEEVEAEIQGAAAVLRSCGAREVEIARDEESRTKLWHARKKAYGALGQLAPDIFVQDAAVPRSTLADLLPRIEEIAGRHDVRLVNFFHAGDGNLHPNLVFDRRDPDEVRRVEAAGAEIMELCVEAGGTITGEHGVGLDKKSYMELIYGPAELSAMRRIKQVFDPAGLCNPDKVLPSEEEGAGVSAGRTRSAPDGIDHRAEDLVLTAPGAASVAEVAEAAAGSGQWLPPAEGREDLTVEELVARAPMGPYEAAYGGMGRHLLAALIEAPDGRTYRWGRPVVKNVAGYDLPRLIAGHGGRLGRVREATLRLWPRAEARQIVDLSPAFEGLAALVAVEPGRDVRPDGCLWTAGDGTGGAGRLRLALFGSVAGVQERAERLTGWAREQGLETAPADGLGRGRIDGSGAVLRARPGDPYLADAARGIGRWMREGGAAAGRMEALPGTGTLRVAVDGAGGRPLMETIDELVALLPEADWRLVAGPGTVRRALRGRLDPAVRKLEEQLVHALTGKETS